MSWTDLEEAFSIIEKKKEEDEFNDPKSEELILLAERTLNLQFPKTYREFLKKYGCGGIGGFEVYGLIHSDFEHSGIPDAIWLTLDERKTSNLPHHFIIIASVGNGEYYAIDCSKVDNNGENPVVVFYPWNANEPKLEKVADDFGKFLKNMISE